VRRPYLLVAVVAIVAAALFVVGNPFAKDRVTKADIEKTVAKRTRGNVQLTLCNQEFVPSQNPEQKPPETWTCDTYIGPSKAEAQDNGPSYEVIVKDGRIASIRRVPTH
jgi:hypothetical protein